MRQRHILVVSQYFYPEQFRINDICEEWIKRGYRVTVLTGIPNYPQGRFYKGYGVWKKRTELYRGIRIVRLPIIARGKHSLSLAMNYLSFVVSGMFWKIVTRIRADYVFIFEVSPMTQALPGIWYARKREIPCYLYVQDLWPDNVEIVTGIHNRYLIGALNRMVNYIYRNCAKIFVTSESFERELIRRGVEKEKLVYWPQYAEDFYRPVPAKKAGNEYRIIFTGNIGCAQGLSILPEAAMLLKREKIRFVLVGDGRYRETLEREIRQKGLFAQFEFAGKKRAEEIPSYLAQADAAFVSFLAHPLFAMTIPAKLQSYLACGMPVIAAASGETRAIVEKAGCGMCCEIGDAQALVDIIKEMKEKDAGEMRSNALRYANTHFNKQQLLGQMDPYFGR